VSFPLMIAALAAVMVIAVGFSNAHAAQNRK
jgi:hypothetical protein